MRDESETIVALATPPGAAALALIRLSGPQAFAFAARLSGRPLAVRRPVHRVLRDVEGRELDDVVMTGWAAPHSYTGEDVVEISCHGNMRIVEAILRVCGELGARAARPGEFTQRAFLNDRMDLTQAEAVMDLIQAGSERALRAARALQSGVLGRVVEGMRDELLETLAHLEAHIDFPEEGIDPETGRALARRIEGVIEKVERLLATAPEGRHLRHGFSVVLTGAPNAGKSSLLNALLQRDRAIVSPLPGTTRDTIEETITLAGMTVRLTDTAGLREGGDEVEVLGMARTREAVAAADLVLHLSAPDALSVPPEADAPVIRVAAKCDVFPATESGWLAVSARTGEGLERLQEAIIRHLHLDESATGHEAVAINTRHEALLGEARAGLGRALAGQAAGAPPELVSADLRQALTALGGIVGEVTNEDVLDRLFRSFCIGK